MGKIKMTVSNDLFNSVMKENLRTVTTREFEKNHY